MLSRWPQQPPSSGVVQSWLKLPYPSWYIQELSAHSVFASPPAQIPYPAVGSVSSSAACWALASRDALRPTIGSSPRLTLSRLNTTSICSSTLRLDQFDGKVSGPT